MKPVSTMSPANFEHRLRTSFVAHAKNESGRLKIINIANVNTNMTNETRSHKFNTRNFQRQFLLQKTRFCTKDPNTIRDNLKR